jgi:hypothetical protein
MLQLILMIGLVVASLVSTPTPATAQTIGQPIRLHDTDQRVNVVTDGQQRLKPRANNSVAALAPSLHLPAGGFVVTWEVIDENRNWLVFARRFSNEGVPIDNADVPVNVLAGVPRLCCKQPAVAGSFDGGYIVTWYNGQDSDGSGIFARRFGSDGATIDVTDIPVNVTTAGQQHSPAIAAFSDGGFVVTWQSVAPGAGSSFWDIVARRFSSDGIPLDSSDLLIKSHSSVGGQYFPSITVRKDNSFVVAWQAWLHDGSGYGIVARRFSADGTPLDTFDIPVNSILLR